jgi:hypothetical protein
MYTAFVYALSIVIVMFAEDLSGFQFISGGPST